MDEKAGRPAPNEAEELLAAARLGAAAAGAPLADREDVAQAVVERFTAKWEEPHLVRARRRGAQAWRAYVAVAARNAYRDLYKKDARRRAREEKASETLATGRTNPRPSVHGPLDQQRSNVDEFLGRQLVVDLIDECLTGRTKEVAKLVFVDGMPTSEIAELLGLSVRTVNGHRKSAIERLRSVIIAEPNDPNGQA